MPPLSLYARARTHSSPWRTKRQVRRPPGIPSALRFSRVNPVMPELLPDPYAVTQMEAAARRIADAATRNEKVAIFGDYDVDGATSAALLTWHLRHCGLDPLIHIPDRIFEGYGPNIEAIRMPARKGP